MHWIAPSGMGNTTDTLEERRWASPDQFRASSGLQAPEYSGPILGIIFLRFAEVRFATLRARLGKASASSRRGSRADEPSTHRAEGNLYVAPNARLEVLLHRPEAADIGAKVDDARRDVEKHTARLAGVRPIANNLFSSSLFQELLKAVSAIRATVDRDSFGRSDDYFLGEFAQTERREGSESITPSCIVRLLTEGVDSNSERILNPACGSGSMFVSSARFVAEHQASRPSSGPADHPSPTGRRDGDEGLAAQYSGDPGRELSIHAVEKLDETGGLCRLNLAAPGLQGDNRHGGQVNRYYDDPPDATGRFDFGLPCIAKAGHASIT